MKTSNYFYALLVCALIIGLWQYLATGSAGVRLLLSKPSLIVAYFENNNSDLLKATWITFTEAFLGLVIAAAVSFGLMIICFYSPGLMRVILSVVLASQVIPLITLAPLFILLFGLGITAKVMMAALLCFFPVFLNFAAGVKQIGSNVHEMLFIYNASISQKIVNIYFPLATPGIMTGLKIAATWSVIGAIVAEFNGADIGLGKNLFLAAKLLEPELMLSSLILSSLLGALMYGLIILIEKRIGKWYLT